MLFIQTKNHGNEMVVVFTGEKYVFFDAFHGIVAVATRKDFNLERPTFDVEYSDVIDLPKVKSIITGNECKYIKKSVQYNCTMAAKCKCLDYYAELNVKQC